MTKDFAYQKKRTGDTKKPAFLVCSCGVSYEKTRPDQERCMRCFLKRKTWTLDAKTMEPAKKKRMAKFDFEKMKSEATSEDPVVRKAAFIEYFERFAEFPSYLFDNEAKIDKHLSETIQELRKDPDTSKPMLIGIEALLDRLPS
jgi:hypothetical protein